VAFRARAALTQMSFKLEALSQIELAIHISVNQFLCLLAIHLNLSRHVRGKRLL
jgi:hypothetical protein